MVAMFHGADDRDAITRIAKQEGVKLSLIPSKGGPSVIKAVTGGHADVGYVGAILYKHVEAGTIKLIAAALGDRLPPIPDVPTLREQGYDEQVEMIVALVAPKDVDSDAKAKLLAAADQLANSEETQVFITENLLMRPVEWGEAHADETVKQLYETFGEQAENELSRGQPSRVETWLGLDCSRTACAMEIKQVTRLARDTIGYLLIIGFCIVLLVWAIPTYTAGVSGVRRTTRAGSQRSGIRYVDHGDNLARPHRPCSAPQ